MKEGDIVWLRESENDLAVQGVIHQIRPTSSSSYPILVSTGSKNYRSFNLQGCEYSGCKYPRVSFETPIDAISHRKGDYITWESEKGTVSRVIFSEVRKVSKEDRHIHCLGMRYTNVPGHVLDTVLEELSAEPLI